MNTRRISYHALALVLQLAFCLSAFADDPKVGDSVAAIWSDGNYYVATVSAVSGENAKVLYEDGDKLDVPLAKIHLLSQSASFKVGDHVIAAWKGARMFPGVITAVSEVSCTVKWDDGDTPLDVKKGRIMLAPK